MAKRKYAVHTDTLDIRVDSPGLRLKDKGYFIFATQEELAAWPELKPLIVSIGGKQSKYGSKLGLASKYWPDIILRAVNNLGGIVDKLQAQNAGIDTEKEPAPAVEAKPKLGRGNHNARIPDFTLTGLMNQIPVPPQAEVLAVEFKKLYDGGCRSIKAADVKPLVLKMNLPTQQDPMRIFRYYFWLLVNAKSLSVVGDIRRDVVTRQNDIRHKIVTTQVYVS
jgi:hypothetical protein